MTAKHEYIPVILMSFGALYTAYVSLPEIGRALQHEWNSTGSKTLDNGVTAPSTVVNGVKYTCDVSAGRPVIRSEPAASALTQ